MGDFVKPFMPKDLIGKQVPFDIASVNWIIGHHVLCKSIIPLENCSDFLVNGKLLLPGPIASKLLELLAANASAIADRDRQKYSAWRPTKISWWHKFVQLFKRKQPEFPGDAN